MQSQSPKPIIANPYDDPLTQIAACPPVPEFRPNVPIRTPFIPTRPMPALVDCTQPVSNKQLSPVTSTHTITNYAKSIAITCRNKHCHATTYDHNLHYLRLHNNVSHATPIHCPMCPANNTGDTQFIRVRPLDTSDMLCMELTPLCRPIAEFCIQEYNNQLTATRSRTRRITVNGLTVSSTSTTNVPNQYRDVQDLIMQNFPKIHSSQGICPLHVSCKDCHATFSVLRTNPTQHANPKYCIWCSSSNITVTLPSTDDTATLVLNLDLIEQNTIAQLAIDYNIPQKFFEIIYDEWSKQAKVKSLKEWMALPSVQKIIQAIQTKQANQTNE